MPVFNGEPFLLQALDALLAQDHEDFELVISDNASTDLTLAICMDVAERDHRVRVHQFPRNLGPVANFNRVLELSRGEYFMWAAADDVWEPAYVSTLLTSLRATSGAVLAFSAFDNIDRRGNPVRAYPDLFELPSESRTQRLMNYMLQDEHLGKANLIYGLMRRDALQAAGGFKEWGIGSWGSDMLIVFRMLIAGSVVLVDDVLFHKRLTETHVDEPSVQGRFATVRATIRDRRGYFAGYADLISSADLLSSSEKALLRSALRRRAQGFYTGQITGELLRPGLRTFTRRHFR
jgi:glycosyltransferase involved in cell wall biosynthesis